MTANNPVAYPPKTKLDSARYWLHEQRLFMAERSMTASGYQAFYAGSYPPEQIQAIYEADLAVLHDFEARVALLSVKDALRKART